MTRLSRKLVKEAGPYGLPIVTLVSDLRKAGYYIPDTQFLLDLLPSLNLKVNLDGETIITN